MSTSHKWVRTTMDIGWRLIDPNMSWAGNTKAIIRTTGVPRYITLTTDWTKFPPEIQTEEDMKAYVEVLVRMS